MPCSGPRAPLLRPFGVERVGASRARGVDGHDGVQRRALLIVGVDSRQVDVDQLARRDLASLHRALQIFDRTSPWDRKPSRAGPPDARSGLTAKSGERHCTEADVQTHTQTTAWAQDTVVAAANTWRHGQRIPDARFR